MSPLRPWKSLGKCSQSPLPLTADPFAAYCSSGCPRMLSLLSLLSFPIPAPAHFFLTPGYVWSMGGTSRVAKCRVREVGIPPHPRTPPHPTPLPFHGLAGLYPSLTCVCGVRGRPLSWLKLSHSRPLCCSRPRVYKSSSAISLKVPQSPLNLSTFNPVHSSKKDLFFFSKSHHL